MTRTAAETAFVEFQRTGDPGALATVFDEVAPELLLVAMHLAPDGVEAEDLVQSTFVALIESARRFDPTQRLLPWLVGILGNHAKRELRSGSRHIDSARVDPIGLPSPDEMAEAEELASAISNAVEGLPQPYREVVTFHWVHGLSSRDIAHATGRPIGTVKSQLHRGLELLRRALPAGFAASAALWLSAGRSLAAARTYVLQHAVELRTGTTAAAATDAARVGSSVTRHVVAFGLLAVVGVIGWLAFGIGPDEDARPVASGAASAQTAAATGGTGPEDSVTKQRTSVDADSDRELTNPDGLLVHVRWHDGQPAANVGVHLVPSRHVNPKLHARWVTTDEVGRAEVESWPAGPLELCGDRGGKVECVVGSQPSSRSCTLTIPRGVSVRGRVLDRSGEPAAHAIVTISSAVAFDDHTHVATTDAKGQYAIRDVEAGRSLSALVPGHAPAGTLGVRGLPGDERVVDLVASDRGTALEGMVQNESGEPVAGAPVMVGNRFRSGRLIGVPPILMLTDEQGRFRTESVPLTPDFDAPVRVRAPGLALWSRTVPVNDGPIHAVMQSAAKLEGRVVDQNGDPAAGVRIELHDPRHHRPDVQFHQPAWADLVVWSNRDGSFSLGGATPGPHHAVAFGPDATQASAMIEVADGDEPTTWSPVLQPSASISGVVLDARGVALEGWSVTAKAPPSWNVLPPVVTDAAGRFEIVRAESCDYELLIRDPRSASPASSHFVRPARAGQQPISVEVPDHAVPSGSIHGRIEDRTGTAKSVVIGVIGPDFRGWTVRVDDPDGRFDIGPLLPGEHVLYIYNGHAFAGVRGPIRLVAGQREDVGDVVIDAHGSLRARFLDHTGSPLTTRRLRVSQTDGRGSVFEEPEDGTVEIPLPPGSYRVDVQDHVSPDGWIETVVEPGALTDVVFTLPKSLQRRFVVTHPADGRFLRYTWTWLDAEGRELSRDHLERPLNDGTPVETTRYLAPGEYGVEVRSHAGLTARAHLIVRASEPDARPIVLDLR